MIKSILNKIMYTTSKFKYEEIKGFEKILEVNESNEYGQTLLHIAAIENKVEDIVKLLNEGADSNIQDIRGKTALHYCAINNYMESTIRLLSAGARVDIEDHFGNYALWDAVLSCNKDYQVIEQLLLCNSDIYHNNKNGLSALDIAESLDEEGIVNVFKRFM